MKIFKHKLKALSLMELCVVLIIVGILVLVALPKMTPMISKAKSVEAQLQLSHLFTMEKSYFYMNSKYSASIAELNFEQAALVNAGGTANFKIEITEATNNAFKARATSITDFDGDGVFNVWEIDQEKSLKEVTPD